MVQQNIKVSADNLIFGRTDNGFQILLVTRKSEPYKGMWCLPGGFVEDDEELDAAAKRELHEETGMRLEYIHQLHAFSAVGRDPRFRVISVAHYAIVDPKDYPDIKAGDDAAELKWFYLKDLPLLAFDHMDEIEFALQAVEGLQ
jgi:8-oxo-dGTP diphosphatase